MKNFIEELKWRDPLLDLARKQYCVKYGAFCLPDREADISLDVLMCMRSHPMPASYDDLREELWYIPLDKIKKALMEDDLRDEACLNSFISGYRLAQGIQQELLADQPAYSFEAEDERQACESWERRDT